MGKRDSFIKRLFKTNYNYIGLIVVVLVMAVLALFLDLSDRPKAEPLEQRVLEHLDEQLEDIVTNFKEDGINGAIVRRPQAEEPLTDTTDVNT